MHNRTEKLYAQHLSWAVVGRSVGGTLAHNWCDCYVFAGVVVRCLNSFALCMCTHFKQTVPTQLWQSTTHVNKFLFRFRAYPFVNATTTKTTLWPCRNVFSFWVRTVECAHVFFVCQQSVVQSRNACGIRRVRKHNLFAACLSAWHVCHRSFVRFSGRLV